jgi:Protein of unknown function (DUF3429)
MPASAEALGAAGLIPFALAAASQWASLGPITPDFGYRAGVIYGAVILSFLGGIRWGAVLETHRSERQAVEFAGSVLASLAAWLALLLPPVMCLSLLIAGFLLQGLWDLIASEQGLLPRWFGTLRMWLTAGAASALALILLRVVLS